MSTGDELRTMRKSAGVSLRALASAIGRDKGHLSRIERGERQPTPAIVADYEAALSGTVEHMRRRSLLATGAALPMLALPDVSYRVGAAEVSAVRSLALNLDLSHPFALETAQTALQRAAKMLHAKVNPTVASSLYEAVALLADRVGWGLLEAGYDATATLAFAHRTAQRGHDNELHAHALLDLAVSTPDPRLGVVTLEHALASNVQGAERANLHAVAARRAAGYDARLARHHLAQSLATEPTSPESEWAQQITCSPGHLDAIIGFACFAVGHPQAQQRLSAAVVRLDAGRRRTRARCYARLAGLSVDGGDDTAAGEHLRQALSTHRSKLVRQDLKVFARRAREQGRFDLARQAEAA